MCSVGWLDVPSAPEDYLYQFNGDLSLGGEGPPPLVWPVSSFPQIQNVPCGWHERSVLLRKSKNIKPFLFHFCAFFTLPFFSPWQVGDNHYMIIKSV